MKRQKKIISSSKKRKRKNIPPCVRVELTLSGSLLHYCPIIYSHRATKDLEQSQQQGQILLFQRRYAQKVYIRVIGRASEWANE